MWNALRSRARRNPVVRSAYYRLRSARHDARLRSLGEVSRGLDPDRIVWIFCTSRSGSTWLRKLLSGSLSGEVWEEPKVGQLFGDFYSRAQASQRGSVDFVLGDPTRRVWVRALRGFVLEVALAANPSVGPEDYLIVKEPDGAIGAPLIMEALPESRMVLLVRDPRDVAASALDGMRRGNWMYETMDTSHRQRPGANAGDPDAFVRMRARLWERQIGAALPAFDDHRGRRSLVRYEDLRANPTGTLARLFSDLELPADAATLERGVERHDWRNIPGAEKGTGKFYRRGEAGGWREDLTPDQARMVEEITSPLLRRFYPD